MFLNGMFFAKNVLYEQKKEMSERD